MLCGRTTLKPVTHASLTLPCHPTTRRHTMLPPLLYNSTPPFLSSTPPSLCKIISSINNSPISSMADRPHQLQVHPQQTRHDAGLKGLLPRNGPSASQVLAVITLLPVGGTLLCLAGITLVGSLIGLAVTTPLFIIFSPVLVPAVITIGLAVTGFISSGAFGLTGLSSLSYVLNYFRRAADTMPEQLEHAKKKAQDLVIFAGQKTKDVGQTIQNKAQQEAGKEGGRT